MISPALLGVVAAAGPAAPEIWSNRQEITILSSEVSSTLTDFPFLLTEANLDSGIWTNAREIGVDLLVTDAAGNRLDSELVEFDPVAQTLRLYVRVPEISSSADTTIYLYYNNPAGSISNKQSTWNSDYEAVVHFASPGELIESANGHTIAVQGKGDTWKRPWWFRPTAKSAGMSVDQGVATDGTNFWTFATSSIERRNGSWVIQQQNSTPFAGFSLSQADHLSDGDVYDGLVYVPFARWVSCEDYGSYGVAVYDATTLALTTEYDLTNVVPVSYSSCYIDGPNDEIIFTDYCTGDKLYIHKLSDMSLLRTIDLSDSIESMQGITRLGNYYYLSASGSTDAVFRVRSDGLVMGIVYTVDPSRPCQGLTNDGTNVYFLTEDSAGSGTGIVETLQPLYAAWFDSDDPVVDGTNIKVDLGQTHTSGAMAAWFAPADNEQRGIVSLSSDDPGTSPNDRTSINIDNGDNLGLWDSNGQSWLYAGINPPLDTLQSSHGLFASGGNREIFHDGATKATGSAGTLPTTRDQLFIGSPDNGASEMWRGQVYEARFMTNQPSSAWIAYEDLNFRTPGSTYSAGAEETGSWAL